LLVFNDFLDLDVVFLLTVTQLRKLVHIVQLSVDFSVEFLVRKFVTQSTTAFTSPINKIFLMSLDLTLIALHVRFILQLVAQFACLVLQFNTSTLDILLALF